MRSLYFVAFLMWKVMRARSLNFLPAQKSPTFVRRKSDENPTDFLLKVRLCLCYTVYADGLQPSLGRGRKMARKWHRYADDTEKLPCYNGIVKKCEQFTCLKFSAHHTLSAIRSGRQMKRSYEAVTASKVRSCFFIACLPTAAVKDVF